MAGMTEMIGRATETVFEAPEYEMTGSETVVIAVAVVVAF